MPYKDEAYRKVYVRMHSQLPEQRERQRRYRLEHPDYNKSSNPIKRTSHLKTRYGITDDDYRRMLARQGGGCAVCKVTTPNNGKGNAWFDVDHDHSTGKVRGLLCRNCNVTLGTLEKKRSLMVLLEQYLFIHQAKTEGSGNV